MEKLFESGQGVYLKPAAKLVPLYCQWYAYPHLVAPVQCALNMRYRFLPMLESYVKSPGTHFAAARNPKLLGGPFINLDPAHRDVAEQLLEATRRECAELLGFAESLRALDTRLQREASGYKLDEFYDNADASIGGLIELVYDINHSPLVRLMEELVYAYGPCFRTQQQVALGLIEDTRREMFISTPNFAEHGWTVLPCEYRDEFIDFASSLRREARPYGSLPSLPGRSDGPAGWDQFLTTTPARRKRQSYTGDGVRVTYFGHACILLETDQSSILIDPLFTFDEQDGDGLSFHDLPEHIDYVVISHSHQDHFCPEMLVQLRRRVGTLVVPRNIRGSIVDPSMRLIASELGFTNIVEADYLDRIELPDGRLTLLPFQGEQCGLDIASKQSLLAELKGHKFLFLIDSEGMDPRLYDRLSDLVHKPDMLFLGMECDGAPVSWFYAPMMNSPLSRENNRSRKANGCDSGRASEIVRRLQPRSAYVYAMGMEAWTSYLLGLAYTPESIQITESNRFVETCVAQGIVSARLNGSRVWKFTGDGKNITRGASEYDREFS